jgi:hypothetical protein
MNILLMMPQEGGEGGGLQAFFTIDYYYRNFLFLYDSSANEASERSKKI